MASENSAIAGLEMLLAGGAGGLGSAAAELLEAEGARVVISSRIGDCGPTSRKRPIASGFWTPFRSCTVWWFSPGRRRAERGRTRCGNRTR